MGIGLVGTSALFVDSRKPPAAPALTDAQAIAMMNSSGLSLSWAVQELPKYKRTSGDFGPVDVVKYAEA